MKIGKRESGVETKKKKSNKCQWYTTWCNGNLDYLYWQKIELWKIKWVLWQRKQTNRNSNENECRTNKKNRKQLIDHAKWEITNNKGDKANVKQRKEDKGKLGRNGVWREWRKRRHKNI